MPEVLNLAAAFPVRREELYVTRVNSLGGGIEYRAAETDAPLCRWDIELRGRAQAEIVELEQRFLDLGGRYGRFIFLDPSDNLLKWSEDARQAAWEKSTPASIAITDGFADPLGGVAAQQIANTAAAPNALTQWMAAPAAGLQLTGSVWLRNSSGDILLELCDGAAETHSALVRPDATWRRYSITAQFSGGAAGQQTGFRCVLPANGATEWFGAQVVPLPAPGAYNRTTQYSGVHPKCRFGSDELALRLVAPGLWDASLAIVEVAGSP